MIAAGFLTDQKLYNLMSNQDSSMLNVLFEQLNTNLSTDFVDKSFNLKVLE